MLERKKIIVDMLSVNEGSTYFCWHIDDRRGKLDNKHCALEGKKGSLSIHDVSMKKDEPVDTPCIDEDEGNLCQYNVSLKW
jgi:hypothetical protein